MGRKKLGNPTTIILKYLLFDLIYYSLIWFRLLLQDLYCPRSEPSCAPVCRPARCVTTAASTRWGHISPAGGALLPGCNPARLPTRSLRSALDFLVRDYGHFLLLFGRGTTPQRCDSGGAVELRARWASMSLLALHGAVGSCCGELVEPQKRICQWERWHFCAAEWR